MNSQVLSKGVLELTVVDAKLTRSTNMFSNMSPFITISHKKRKMKTKVADYQDKTPAFNNSFQLDIENTNELVTLRGWHQGTFKADPIGFCQLPVSALMINCGV